MLIGFYRFPINLIRLVLPSTPTLLMGFLVYLTTFWAVFEPISALGLFLLRYFDRKKQRTSYREFTSLSERAYELTAIHIERFGIKRDEFAPRAKKVYIDELKQKIQFKHGSFEYRKGELELYFLSKYILPKESRIDHFLIVSYYFIEGYLEYLPFLLRREKRISRFTRKKTFYHYVSIDKWSSKSLKKLIAEVPDKPSGTPMLNEKHNFERAEDILKDNPTISKTIDVVLKKGKITERTIFNLASSEKLVIVHKYAEGFTEIFSEYRILLEEAKANLERAKKSTAKDAGRRIQRYSTEYDQIRNNWPRVPLNVTLEKQGFQTIFNNLKGVYVFPLSMIPEKFHKNIREYFEEIIIPESEQYLIELRANNPIVDRNIQENKYLFLTHVVSISELEIYSKDRQLDISSKALSKMLLTTFLSKDDSKVSSIYLNDIIRNADFMELLNGDTKSGAYLKRNFETIKEIIYRLFSLDITKPTTLINLTKEQVGEIIDDALDIDNSGSKRHLVNMFYEKIIFYQELNQELNKIISKKKNL